MPRAQPARTINPAGNGVFREDIGRYLPLNRERAALFLNDWEGFVTACLRRMRVDELEDSLFRVFQRALNALPGFRGDSKISTWLYRIAWREGIRSLEVSGRIQKRETFLEDVSLEPGADENAEQILLKTEAAERVRRALEKLGPIDREILALRYMEDLKLTEIAERLDVPLGTAKVRVHRALARIKLILEKDHDE
jgi:RNA polymerase sigma factor (sigma-70 family)